ncbi:MFS transporter [Saccharothrix violaceirubra]|uniref:Putative MFS family arabinose efflux permease n=1 Tax=Saccharothrix violaceirubra TaxID=413306 RepID=A0A7W7WTP3_9PSEU|nr:MFS transporter [Saccharothrix violaceirubra]MBB4963376.1 putative MFS family arabinose efflux permease [Saccharothrix violaceirubra]
MATTRSRLPALLALATAAFTTVLTEALPAGVLPEMSRGLSAGESATGQLVTAYAVGTALTAIPLSLVTARWRRRVLLLSGVSGFAVANTVTALSESYWLTLAARFGAGIAAGVVWALLAGYARRLVPEPLAGKAIAIVMTGIPLALSLGVPAGTALGEAVGWRWTFGVMSVLAAVLSAWIALAVPDFPGLPSGGPPPLRATLAMPGVRWTLFVTLVFVLAHNTLFTYIASLLDYHGLSDAKDLALLLFGIASVVGTAVVGALIDRASRPLLFACTVLVALAALALAALPVPLVAITVWGLAWGGVPTLLQTAAAVAAGPYADPAQAALVTLWNVAIAAGGVAGGVLLSQAGPTAPAYTAAVLLLFLAAVGRRNREPAPSR